MIAPGFRGNYFSLVAMTLTNALPKLQAKITALKRGPLLTFSCFYEDPPPQGSLELQADSKPCYCNIFFACAAHNALKLARLRKPPLCRCRYTKSGIAPPSSFA
ncbi:MAG: hypothetical protein C6H99_05615 [Epsilonproteobacteria bacterium]|nr:hypothetical protein [Campylobacterota bacterium]NPA65156.1 hypothetical protein [Campylobacterota bacterium]